MCNRAPGTPGVCARCGAGTAGCWRARPSAGRRSRPRWWSPFRTWPHSTPRCARCPRSTSTADLGEWFLLLIQQARVCVPDLCVLLILKNRHGDPPCHFPNYNQNMSGEC